MEQSRNELLAATCVWATLTFCLAIFGVFAVLSLRSLRFIDSPDTRPTLWFCVKRLGPVTSVYLSATISVVLSATCVITYLTSIVPGLFKYTIECYVTTFSLMGYVTGMSRTMVKIYHEETCQGREKLAKKEKAAREPKGSTQREPTTRLRRASSSYLLRYRTPTFWRTYAKAVSVTLPVFLANIFVHVLSRQRLVDRDGVVLTGFVVASIVFKLAVQEIVKLYIFRRRVRSARVMCVLVGIPTVIIDTQTRIILIGKNNTNTAAMGALGMAVIEIFLRAGKTMRVMWEVRHHEHALERQNNVSCVVHQPQAPKTSSKTSSRPSMTVGMNDFEVWRRQVQAFHTAELNADMYAEYISIGCSASILFFHGNRPHYASLRQAAASTEATTMDNMAWRVSQLKMLGFQIGIEIIVDYISTVLEMVIGIEFDHVKKLNSFLAAMFIITAVMNINISVCIYLR
ncbi:hypothetical protein PHYSODRAFT_498157 [Phytophthora sojae]|uniref:Uncharacterized protein n=1 Tax=Phytophthora sojae (strain P6497) TaxID=1094619 RepID=G4ZJU1_PHYSP|nr:hypothetical protein PHYSODRAFT_498157 [Phytophthora sojae]EGZ18902.1 hypothetical protein PHYSODRAFT_498157 [Phytophthora sojae]|eukprot:XP_009527960.1 hypothetical protein PHYSODRAFT_498157 [Phytophthora sojae]